MSGPAWDFAVGNGQARPGDNAIHNVFRVIMVQGVQRAAPAHQFATRELSFYPRGVFLVLIMEALEKEFALFYPGD
jgi:hypothetical protein